MFLFGGGGVHILAEVSMCVGVKPASSHQASSSMVWSQESLGSSGSVAVPFPVTSGFFT